MSEAVKIIGLGNGHRSDDAVGLIVAERLTERTPLDVEVISHSGEATSLMDMWESTGTVIVVDAVLTGAEPGAILRLELEELLSAGVPSGVSTHGLGIAEAIRLGESLGRLPDRIILYGVEGENFEMGGGLSVGVEAAIDGVVDSVLGELKALTS